MDDARDPVIVSAVRTPMGSFGGSLRDVLHERLAATVMEEVGAEAQASSIPSCLQEWPS